MKSCLIKICSEKNIYYFFYTLIFLLACYCRIRVYMLGYDIHCDEACLALNLIDKNYLQFFQPLDNMQVAPPVFLILSKLVYNIAYLNYTIDFSNSVLRILPFIFGISAIPAFGYLLNKLFKNRFITLLGMFFIAANPVHIAYSTIFKQYSLEALITILIFILFINIDFDKKTLKYNLTMFGFLGLSLFCSMTAVYIIPGGFIYLLLKLKSKENFKSFILCTLFFSTLFIFYLIIYLLPVYNAHYEEMCHWWSRVEINKNNFYRFFMEYCRIAFRVYGYNSPRILTLTFIAGSLVMFFKNTKLFFLSILPMFITFLFVKNGSYPIEERLLLFLLPVYLITVLYLLSIIPLKYFCKYRFFKYSALIFIIYYIVSNMCSLQYINQKYHPSKSVWNYYMEHYKGEGMTIFFPYTFVPQYYLIFEDKEIPYVIFKTMGDLKPGIYYVLGTRLLEKDSTYYDKWLKDYEIIEYKDYSRIPNESGTYMKIRKL